MFSLCSDTGGGVRPVIGTIDCLCARQVVEVHNTHVEWQTFLPHVTQVSDNSQLIIHPKTMTTAAFNAVLINQASPAFPY